MRVLHGPVNVGNQPWTLSRAERKLGLKSDVAVNYGTWLGYPADVTVGTYQGKTVADRLRRSAFGLSAPFKYDVLHYYFGRNFFLWDDYGMAFGRSAGQDKRLLRDVRLAKRLGKRTFMTLQGCDIRLAKQSFERNRWTPCHPDRCGAFDSCAKQYDFDREAMSRALLPLMDRVFYLNPELGHYVPNGVFLPYANVDLDRVERRPPTGSRRVKIVHAPSDPKTKGTDLIMAALDRLASRYQFELILVQGLPHAEAMELYRSADLAIDQILFGWYGGFAVELMAMGKPVAAFIREEDREYVPSQMWEQLPILRLDPSHLERDLSRILEAPELLIEYGKRSEEFVRRWHDPGKIARGMIELYEHPEKALSLI